MARKLYIILIGIALILVDQLTKYFSESINVTIIPKILSISYTTNYGAAFGLMPGWNVIFVAASVMIVAIIIWHFESLGSEAGALLLVSGALGNLIDRMFLGYVRDFISVSIWPVFNLADSFGVIGVVLIAYHSLLKRHLVKKGKK